MPLFRTQSAAEKTSLAPHDSKARLLSGRDSQGFMAKPCTPHLITRKGYATSVRQQSCQRLCNPQAEQLFKIETANVRGRGGRPLVLSLGGLKGGYSLSEKENIPLCRVPTRCGARSSAAALHPPCALQAQKETALAG